MLMAEKIVWIVIFIFTCFAVFAGFFSVNAVLSKDKDWWKLVAIFLAAMLVVLSFVHILVGVGK